MLTEGGEAWTIISPGVAFGYADKNAAIADANNLRRIDRLYLPTTLTNPLARQYYNWTENGSVMPKFVMDCPSLSTTLTKWLFHYFCAQEWILRVPSVTETADSLMEISEIGEATNFGKWNFESLKTIARYAIYNNSANDNGGGTLALPSVSTIKYGAFHKLSADAIEFGRTTDRSGGLETIETNVLSGSASHLKELSFLSKRTFTVGKDAFAVATALEKVTILGRPIDATSLSNIVSAVSAASDKTCSIYVGYKVRGTSGESWMDLVDPNLTPDEEPFRPVGRPDAKFLGVIGNPVRNCWVFGIDSPYDPKGVVLIVR